MASASRTSPLTSRAGWNCRAAPRAPSSTEVDPGSPAAEGGLRRFDVITQVNGQPVQSAADASKKLQAIGSGRLARILVMRGGQELGFAIRKD